MYSATLAEFLGVYTIIVSGVFLFRHRAFVRYAQEFITNPTMRYNVAFVELAAGLGIIAVHNVWTVGYQGVITILGWLLAAEAVFHLAATEEQERTVVEAVTKDVQWAVLTLLTILLGLYLATKGFTAI